MFFTTLIAAPLIAGVVAGVLTGNRRVPWGLTAICLGLGATGAVASAFNPDGRADNITFSLIAALVCGGLAWAGYAGGRLSRRSARQV